VRHISQVTHINIQHSENLTFHITTDFADSAEETDENFIRFDRNSSRNFKLELPTYKGEQNFLSP
jgi:hypothetical protein